MNYIEASFFAGNADNINKISAMGNEKTVLTQVSIVSLAVTAVYAVGAFIFAYTVGKSQSRIDKLIIAWLVFDALIHFTLVSVIMMRFITYF